MWSVDGAAADAHDEMLAYDAAADDEVGCCYCATAVTTGANWQLQSDNRQQIIVHIFFL